MNLKELMMKKWASTTLSERLMMVEAVANNAGPSRYARFAGYLFLILVNAGDVGSYVYTLTRTDPILFLV